MKMKTINTLFLMITLLLLISPLKNAMAQTTAFTRADKLGIGVSINYYPRILHWGNSANYN